MSEHSTKEWYRNQTGDYQLNHACHEQLDSYIIKGIATGSDFIRNYAR
jgi:hypothetical protein